MSKRIAGVAAIIAGLVLTSMNVMADATLYRWKDSQGNMVMSDRQPPAGTEYEAISTDSSVVRRVEGEAPPEQVVSKPRAKADPTPEPKAVRTVYEKNPEYCASARKNLTVIDQSARIRMQDKNGEYYYISDEQREAERQKNLEVIELHCD